MKWSCFVKSVEGDTLGQHTHGSRAYNESNKETGKRDFIEMYQFTSHQTVTFELRMKMDKQPKAPFVPNNPFSDNMRQLFLDNDTSDVSFVVNGESLCGHRSVLKLCAPTLYEMCEKTKSVPISGIRTETFRNMLQYVYGGKVPSPELEEHAREYIEGADKFGVTNLKLEAEAIYVAKVKLAVGNVVVTLLYAEARNLALLKEAAMDFIHKNAEEVLSDDSFKSIPADKGILSELLSVVAMKSKGSNKTGAYKAMPVGDLRWVLASKKLDIDGSRDMLVARLEEHANESGKKRKAAEN